MKKITYKKDGVRYSAVIKAYGQAAIQLAMLKKGVGMSQVESVEEL